MEPIEDVIAAVEEEHKLLEYAFHLRVHGERAPGGNETWAEFDRRVEAFLRSRQGEGGGYRPRRDDSVAAWIKRRRDEFPRGEYSSVWQALDMMLDDYREHADTGTPLDRDVQGPHWEES